MSYKGDDLDLRTPDRRVGGRDVPLQAGETIGAGLWSRAPAQNGGLRGPLWVDDLLMATINHAYDLAVAHRAAEVHLEHLINAWTLDATATRILEAHGIGTQGLRRESAAIVATIIPASLNGNNVPRTSEGLEELLRLAAGRAYPRHTPISIDTLLEAMTDMKQDLTGLDLLRRHATPRKTVRFQATDEPTRDIAGPPGSSILTDSVQNSRLDALEQLVRTLTAELTAERQNFHNIAAAPVRRHTIAARSEEDEEAIRLVAERLQAIESGIETRFGDLASGWVDIADRLGEIESKVANRLDAISRIDTRAIDEKLDKLTQAAGAPPNTDHLETKLTAMERSFGLVLDRLTGLERQLETVAAGTNSVDLTGVTSRFATLESRTADVASGTRSIADRIAALEGRLEAAANRPRLDISSIEHKLDVLSGRPTLDPTMFDERLSTADSSFEQRALQLTAAQVETIDELHDAVVKLNTNQQTLATSIDGWRLDQTGDIGLVANRLQSVEQETHGLKTLVETMASNIGVVYAILSRREENKSKIRHWLFGTDDWYSASWDTARWRQRIIDAGGFVPMPRRRPRETSAR